MLELTRNYRAENDVDFAEFIADLRIIKRRGKPDFKTYANVECHKLLCCTNKTRKSINYKWMMKESNDQIYMIVNNFQVFVGLPVICNKTMIINKTIDLKIIEEYEVINVDDKMITIKNDRLQAVITNHQFKHFDLSYSITTHVSQGSTYDFPYS